MVNRAFVIVGLLLAVATLARADSINWLDFYPQPDKSYKILIISDYFKNRIFGTNPVNNVLSVSATPPRQHPAIPISVPPGPPEFIGFKPPGHAGAGPYTVPEPGTLVLLSVALLSLGVGFWWCRERHA